jgi:membrane-associated protein
MVAAVGGDSINYVIGRYLGKRIVDKKDSRLINRKHLDRTHEFFKKYGGKTIILARFVPIVRTFAPFVAGFIHMDYPRFFLFNVAGGILWVGLFVMGGFFFGNIPVIKENLTLVMLLIVIGSILPGVFEIIRAKRHKA